MSLGSPYEGSNADLEASHGSHRRGIKGIARGWNNKDKDFSSRHARAERTIVGLDIGRKLVIPKGPGIPTLSSVSKVYDETTM